MDSEDKPFLECIDAFARHDYERAWRMAIDLLPKRMFLWIVQVMLISLERCGNYDTLRKAIPMTLNSFSDSPFAIGMIKLSVGQAAEEEFRNFPGMNERQILQLNYYEASRRLTLGDRSAAVSGFRSCATASVKYPERDWAESELKMPEPADDILRRLGRQAQQPAAGFPAYDIVTCARSAVAILKNETINDRSVVLPLLEILIRKLKDAAPNANSAELRQQLDELHQIWRSRDDARPAATKTGFLQRIRDAALGVRGSDAKQEIPGSGPPFTRFSGRLRQIRSDALEPLQKLALDFSFPLFFGRHPFLSSPEREIHQSMRAMAKEGDSREVSRYCRRRFSGDTSKEFPRSRYHHAVPNDSDDPTLFRELNNYSIPSLVGFSCARPGPEHDVIELLSRGLPDEPNPLFLGLARPESFDHVFKQLPDALNPLGVAAANAAIKALVPSANEFVTSVRVTTGQYDFEKCLDLRRPEARRWLVDFFNNPPASLHGDALKVLANAHDVDLHAIRTWADLIPVIYAQTNGGNPLTDMVGTYLRTCGCDALIYPSARADTMVHWVDGELKNFKGWNLVDYRGAGMPEMIGIDVGDPIQKLPGRQEFDESTQGPEQGSLCLKGNSLLNRIANQMHFERYIMLHGPEWRLKHHHELYARGFFWYSRLYGRGEAFVGICPSCAATFDDPDVQILEQCPRCNYGGDW